MHRIIFTIPLHGNPTLKVEGVKGTKCKDITSALEKALGKVVKDEATPDMNERPIHEQINQY
jgi:hypothetical protein